MIGQFNNNKSWSPNQMFSVIGSIQSHSGEGAEVELVPPRMIIPISAPCGHIRRLQDMRALWCVWRVWFGFHVGDLNFSRWGCAPISPMHDVGRIFSSPQQSSHAQARTITRSFALGCQVAIRYNNIYHIVVSGNVVLICVRTGLK